MRNLTRKQRDEIEQLAKMSDSDTDTSDVQEATQLEPGCNRTIQTV